MDGDGEPHPQQLISFFGQLLHMLFNLEERRDFRERGDSYDENDTWVWPALLQAIAS